MNEGAFAFAVCGDGAVLNAFPPGSITHHLFSSCSIFLFCSPFLLLLSISYYTFHMLSSMDLKPILLITAHLNTSFWPSYPLLHHLDILGSIPPFQEIENITVHSLPKPWQNPAEAAGAVLTILLS
ncbi:hypothetical protein AVEN_32505-1 [Araneus ventricosus]|uniref:Uncharacterized protein n=1 Tax=Araneus ventricosus TaxID=182803 RepID=A0A4Y2VRB1_ARAVE|nr:hypothetical protein AVEN_32505-1 [Araneus ventricosus]